MRRKNYYIKVFFTYTEKTSIGLFLAVDSGRMDLGTPSKGVYTEYGGRCSDRSFRIVRNGDPFGFGLWVGYYNSPNDTKLFDRYLPAGDFMSSLSRLVGQERIDLGYKELRIAV